MDKKKWLRVVNVLLALDFLGIAGSGITQGVFGYPIPYELFRLAHPIGGYLLVALVATHLWLNWGWVKSTYFSKARTKAE